MAILKKEFYIVKCDECKDELDSAGYGGFTVYPDEAEARDALEEHNWDEVDGQVVCDNCYNVKTNQ